MLHIVCDHPADRVKGAGKASIRDTTGCAGTLCPTHKLSNGVMTSEMSRFDGMR
jgi:hypothetical protein